MRSSLIFLALPLALAAPLTSTVRLPDELVPRQANGSCDVSGLTQPANTMTPPPANLKLVLIAEGHGTQNYSCANDTASPAAIGAVASLFNVSCAAANGELGSIAEDPAAIGAHFFVDSTTPEFDIIGLGDTRAKKAESMAAPDPANVPWLRLVAQEAGTTSPVKQIYRLNTVGGLAPGSCYGQSTTSAITVEYTAQYWIYADPAEMAARRKRRSLGLPAA